jgi:hypothetical protein
MLQDGVSRIFTHALASGKAGNASYRATGGFQTFTCEVGPPHQAGEGVTMATARVEDEQEVTKVHLASSQDQSNAGAHTSSLAWLQEV